MLKKELNGFMTLDGDELFYINGGTNQSSGIGAGIPGNMTSPTGTPSNPSSITIPSGK